MSEDELRLRKLRAEAELAEMKLAEARRVACGYCGGRGSVLINTGVNTSGGHNGHVRGTMPPGYRERCPSCGGRGWKQT